jgi:hypothetical protein
MADQFLFPTANLRSNTAVPGKADARDEHIYSALLLQHGAQGNATAFAVPRGQAIPRLNGAGITASTNAWQSTYTELTTNVVQAGQLGNSIGDASVRNFGITIEQMAYDSVGSQNATYGAGPTEQAEILNKCHFLFRVASKPQIQGPVFCFPSAGALYGTPAIATTANATTRFVGVVNNGLPGTKKRLKIPIMIGRTDPLEGVLTVAGAAALAFTTTTGTGQPTLVWFVLDATVKGDVR